MIPTPIIQNGQRHAGRNLDSLCRTPEVTHTSTSRPHPAACIGHCCRVQAPTHGTCFLPSAVTPPLLPPYDASTRPSTPTPLPSSPLHDHQLRQPSDPCLALPSQLSPCCRYSSGSHPRFICPVFRHSCRSHARTCKQGLPGQRHATLALCVHEAEPFSEQPDDQFRYPPTVR